MFLRTATKDTELRGVRVNKGERAAMFYPSANRDETQFADPDRFDITRTPNPHVAFGGGGTHFCLGANLARLEGRVALDEVLNRFPDWEVDYEHIELAPTSTVRGWDAMPVFVR